ncbi:MAG: hypothetical protein JHC84_01975 [Solirubrobacteraceae bacterium]|nr:hypothetical protein [Solirubrobacteraceae bacterium]
MSAPRMAASRSAVGPTTLARMWPIILTVVVLVPLLVFAWTKTRAR